MTYCIQGCLIVVSGFRGYVHSKLKSVLNVKTQDYEEVKRVTLLLYPIL